jgi:hypothetical protein
VEAEVSGNELQVRAKCFGAGRLPATLEARFVPLPGKTLRLAPTGAPGEYRGAMALSDLGVRYDYAAQRYVPYFGALEVTVSGRAGARTAAAACVVNVPERKGVAP